MPVWPTGLIDIYLPPDVGDPAGPVTATLLAAFAPDQGE